MELDLNTKIQYLKGVGPKLAEKLHRLGIGTIRDLIFCWPRTYIDYTDIVKIGDIGNISTPPLSKGRLGGVWEDEHGDHTTPNPSYLRRGNQKIRQLGNYCTIRARILGISNKLTSRQRMKVTEAVVEDGTGTVKLIWFNQPFLQKMLRPGSEWIFRGQVDHNFFTSEWVMESPSYVKRPCIVPVYPTTAGLTSNYIAKLVSSITHQVSTITDFLPEGVMKKYDLLPLQKAIIQIHTPRNFEQIEAARKRLAFDELFLISLRSRLSKEELSHEQAPAIKIDDNEIKSFVENLPYGLTGDQKKAVWQILGDMSGSPHPRPLPPSAGEGDFYAPSPSASWRTMGESLPPTRSGGWGEGISPMNRLLNGDVGSGKTVVAAIAAYTVIQSGYQVVLMVPTEILATQHFETFSKLFIKERIIVGLITSNMKKVTDERNKPQEANVIIGTQALLQKTVKLGNVGLVIADEQHRFGVKQRALLKEKTDSQIKPHFLSMTATPIPRTLHLALFGDLDVSVINEKPKNRRDIKTRFVEAENRMKAYDFIRSHIKAGRQAFVICPLISPMSSPDLIGGSFGGKIPVSTGMTERGAGMTERGAGMTERGLEATEGSGSLFGLTQTELFDQDRKSVVKEYEKLSKEVFSEFKVAMLHGKMKSKEKEAILSDFYHKKYDILVSTSVIEVGIDVPNATVMMIEDAERFGLAQIHQFRGRVGRAEHQSFCLLFSNTRSQNALIRLRSLENVSDGFKLAEIDLEMRGPGDMFGTMQSGQLELKMATFSDRILIEQASQAASEIIQKAPHLDGFAGIKEKLAEFEASRHME